jgi:hypothetical protein
VTHPALVEWLLVGLVGLLAIGTFLLTLPKKWDRESPDKENE